MKGNHGSRTRVRTAVCSLALAAGLAASALPGAATASAAVSPGPGVRPLIWTNIYNTASQLCLGISGARNQAPAILWPCNGWKNQTWGKGAQSPSNPDYFQLKNQQGSCLGLAGGSTRDGTQVMGWRCLGPSATNQYWLDDCRMAGQGGNGCVLHNLAAPPDPLGFGGKVMGVAGGSVAVGASVVIWANSLGPNFAPNQAWYMAW